MRALHVVPTWWPATRYGGTIVSTRALCHALVRCGVAVEVATTSVDGSVDSAVPVDRSMDDGGVVVRYCRCGTPRRIYRSPPMRRVLSEQVPLAHIVHAHSVFLWPTWAAAGAARRFARPLVISPRGMFVQSLIDARSRLAKTLWIALIERHNLRQAAAIHVTSVHERDALLALGLGTLPPLVVIPNGVALPPATSVHSQPGRVLFVGRLSAEKRIDRLLLAIVGIPAAQLEIIGPDTDKLQPVLQARAAELGIAHRVVFRGLCDQAEVWDALARCTVLVLPSRSENFGNVVAEAMAAGRPVVVTPEVGAAAIVLAAGAGLVASADDGSLAAAIARVLGDPTAAQALGQRGAVYARRELSWDAVAIRMREMYAEFIRPAARR